MTGNPPSNRAQGRQRIWPAAVAGGVSLSTLALLAAVVEVGVAGGASIGSASPAASQGACLLPAPQMRRLHATILYEERRAAVREGRRNPERQLGRCISCHVVHDSAGLAVSADEPRHFCRTCHDQAAVANDCFSCHRSTPAASQTTDLGR